MPDRALITALWSVVPAFLNAVAVAQTESYPHAAKASGALLFFSWNNCTKCVLLPAVLLVSHVVANNPHCSASPAPLSTDSFPKPTSAITCVDGKRPSSLPCTRMPGCWPVLTL